MNKITKALNNLFDKFRIVFWYDVNKELRSEYDQLELDEVSKVEILNNEFVLKYQILREESKQKFLLYKEGPQPKEEDNWLLDVQLSHTEFRTDQAAIWLSELELGMEFTELVKKHNSFFRIKKRRDALKALLEPHDTLSVIKLKMLSICVKADVRLDSILEKLLEELSKNKDAKFQLIQECALNEFLWKKIADLYNYQSAKKSIEDFAIELFKSCYALGTDGEVNLNSESLVFLSRWKDSIKQKESFRKLSETCSEVLGIEDDLQAREYSELVKLDYFSLIERKIIVNLVQGLGNQSISADQCTQIIRQRRQSHWYSDFEHLYQAIEMGANFIYTLQALSMEMNSLQDGIEKYSTSWYKVDQLYRRFIYFLNQSGQTTLLDKLSSKIENLYSNEYLLNLGNKWQQFVDPMENWQIPDVGMQKDFFKAEVQSKLNTGKVFVIISDALRYEVGEEVVSAIRQANKFEATIKPYLSMLPSYTQLGMAALLPNKELEIIADKTTTTLVDGQSSQGRVNRAKILAQAVPRSCVVKAKDVLKYNREELRAFCTDHDTTYIYHNLIDHTGDNLESEESVFKATNDAIEELVRLLTKLGGINYVTNFIVTADHGFIYQNQPLGNSDYLSEKIDKEKFIYSGRRFAYGHNIPNSDSCKNFNATQLGLKGDLEVTIPKSINRMRLQGSGSRFVHGGASLQEVVIPVVSVTKKRSDDANRDVEVEILQRGSSVITSGQLAITCYQTEAATEKIQPRILRVGLYNQDGELISDTHELLFDFTYTNPRERELPVRLILSQKADDANGQEVYLRLEQQKGKTSHYMKYKEIRYMLRRSFTSDFDF